MSIKSYLYPILNVTLACILLWLSITNNPNLNLGIGFTIALLCVNAGIIWEA